MYTWLCFCFELPQSDEQSDLQQHCTSDSFTFFMQRLVLCSNNHSLREALITMQMKKGTRGLQQQQVGPSVLWF
jgi:hypothetical protein